jgi:pentapeptide repeats protein
LRGCSFYQNRLWESKIRDDKTITGAKITIFDFFTQIYPYWKHQNDPQWEKLTKPEQKVAIQTFCNETDMIIFDLAGNEVAKPES